MKWKLILGIMLLFTIPIITQAQVDTLSIGGKRFIIVPSTKEAFQKIRSVTFDTSEKRNLARDAKFVKRRGDTLFLALANGRNATLVHNRSDGEPLAMYSYKAVLKELGYYYISGTAWEGHINVLIDKTTGDTAWLAGKPIISPDRKWIICAAFDESGESLAGFAFYRVLEHKIELLGKTLYGDFMNWCPVEAKWLDNSNLLVKRLIDFTFDREPNLDYIKLKLLK
jgi:hypothetical protein